MTLDSLQLNVHYDFNNNMNHISLSSIKFRSVIILMLCFQDCQFTKIKDNTLFASPSKETSMWKDAVAAVSDGSSLSMAPSAATSAY